jgi:hypothetical protein
MRLEHHRACTAAAVLALSLSLTTGAARGAAEMTAWATADGTSPAHLVSHEAAADAAGGPNGTYAVGSWSGPARHGSWGGFGLTLPAWTPTRVELLLAGYVTAPVTKSFVSLTLQADGVGYGPVVLTAAGLNTRTGAAAAGVWAVDLTALFSLPTGALAGDVELDLRLLRHGPDEGAELWLDAVGVRARVENPAETFDLWMSGDAATLEAAPPARLDVSAPVDVAVGECPYRICYVQVRDSSGESRKLSVLLLPDGETVRVGFDDGRADAPVDGSLSVAVAPAEGLADGVSRVRLEVTPRDAAGLPLGEGVNLRLDPDLLGPAGPVGSWRHLGNGTWALDLAAMAPGFAVSAVTADDVALQQAPQTLFVAP